MATKKPAIINGLQTGKVIQLDDPQGKDRVLVNMPAVDNTFKGIWTRIVSFDRGAFFPPEIGDEVIVGFINDDPKDAVLLGVLYSSSNSSPIKAQANNPIKGLTTRSQMHLTFNDKTRTITIDTPLGNRIVLSDDDKAIEIQDVNGNKIIMNHEGIKLDSPKSITISAGTDITISAGALLQIHGASLSLKGDADVSIAGATVKLAGTATTEISGSIVKIN